MPAATSKGELTAVTEKEYEKLEKLLISIDSKQAKAKFDDTSIKDVIGHRAHWISLFLGWHKMAWLAKKYFFLQKAINGVNSRNITSSFDWINDAWIGKMLYRFCGRITKSSSNS